MFIRHDNISTVRKLASLVSSCLISIALAFSLSFPVPALAFPSDDERANSSENVLEGVLDSDAGPDNNNDAASEDNSDAPLTEPPASTTSQQDPPSIPENPWRVDLALDLYELSGKDAAEYAPRYTREMLPVVKCARAAILDANGKYVYGKNARSRSKIASTTKIMCAIVVSSYPMETPILVTAGSAYIPGSTANLIEGDETTIYELLKGLMLPSGNDAAYALAIGCGHLMLEEEGRGEEVLDENACVTRFVEKMNEKAQELGMEDTLFVNPCGLDDEGFEGEHASSAYDVAVMTRAAYDIPAIREIVAKESDIMLVTRAGEQVEVPLDNTNRLLGMMTEAVGMKTGFTDAAGSCVACVFDDGTGSPMFVAILGADNGDDSFDSGMALYKWVAGSKMSVSPLSSLLADADDDGILSLGRVGHRDWLDKDFEISVQLPAKDATSYTRYAWEEDLRCAVELDNMDEAACGDIEVGSVLGRVVVYGGEGDIVDEFPVITSESIAAPDAIEKVWVDAVRFFSSLVGTPITCAPDTIKYQS